MMITYTNSTLIIVYKKIIKNTSSMLKLVVIRDNINRKKNLYVFKDEAHGDQISN